MILTLFLLTFIENFHFIQADLDGTADLSNDLNSDVKNSETETSPDIERNPDQFSAELSDEFDDSSSYYYDDRDGFSVENGNISIQLHGDAAFELSSNDEGNPEIFLSLAYDETGNKTILKEISREEFLHDDYQDEDSNDETIDMWTDNDETSNKLGEVANIDGGNFTSHSISDDPAPFFQSLLSGAAEAHQQKLNRSNEIITRENLNDTQVVISKASATTDQPIIKIEEARVLKTSKLTFMVILIVWFILTVIVIAAVLLIKLFCNCEIFKLICCDKLGNRPIMTSTDDYSGTMIEDIGDDDVFVAERDVKIPEASFKNDMV